MENDGGAFIYDLEAAIKSLNDLLICYEGALTRQQLLRAIALQDELKELLVKAKREKGK